jgi:hypothetical protein
VRLAAIIVAALACASVFTATRAASAARFADAAYWIENRLLGLARRAHRRRGELAVVARDPRSLALVSLHLAACGAPPPPTTIELPPPRPAPAEVAATGADDAPRPAAPFYLEDPVLDGLEPPARWTIRQETLGSSQHCYELFYPEGDLDAVAASTNAALARKGIAAKLPEPVKTAKLVGYLDTKGYPRSISPRLAPTEPLLKLILCHLAVPPVPTIDKVITHLIHLPAARELEALGKPTLAWKREYRDRRPEYGLVLPGLRPAML